MKRFKLSASIMCADLMNIESQIKKLEKAQIDFIHIDLVDNKFSPNLTFGPEFINQLRQITTIPFEIHYMVNSPKNIVKSLNEDEIQNTHIFHLNIENSVDELREIVKSKNDYFGIALLPDDEVSSITKYINYLDVVLLLSVYPGFFGSKFIESSYDKARKLVEVIKNKNIDFCSDGAMSLERSIKMSKIGANIFVGGTSSIFNKNDSIEGNIKTFNKIINS
jgi:ribulose-phosphate 3-epimerase